MTAALLRPQPLPLERVRPGVGLLVLGLHLALLWVANLYWPLQNVLLGAAQNMAQSIPVQIIQKTTERKTPDGSDSAALNASTQAISNPGRQRFGRAETMLELPAVQLDASTPLAGTLQIAQAAPPVPSRPVPEIKAKPAIAPSARPVPQAVAAPEPVQAAAVRTVDEKLPDLAPIQTPVAASAAPSPAPPVAAIVPPVAPALPAVTTAPVPLAAAPAISTSPAATSLASTSSSSGAVTASGAALASGSGSVLPGAGSAAAPALAPTGTGAPLNLNLPPRYIYRPPMAVPRRSLSEMANEQLRRKPRDPFAEGIEAAGNIDCLKDAPEGPAQGLLAIGPLLKRAIEEKCRK